MKNLCLILFGSICLPMFAQDFVFTNFVQTPLFLGPQFASGSEQSVNAHSRVQGHFRSNSTTYYSNFLAFNKNILSDSANTFAIAPKLSFDKAGESLYTNNGYGLSFAYSRKIKESQSFKNVTSTGIDVVIVHSSANEQDLRWPSQISSTGFDPNAPGEYISNINYVNINVGLNTRCEWDKLSFDLGYTVFNVNRPKTSLLSGIQSQYRKYIRHQYYIKANYALSNSFSLNPRFLYTHQGPHSTYITGSDVSYNLDQNTTVSVGSGVMKNGNYFTAGFSVNKFRMALCFDVFNTIDFYGGELNMSYSL